ncbi:MAG: hypothetical protein ACRDJG_09315 [Actinomycetota bacterium]
MPSGTNFYGSVLKAIACTRNRNFNDAEYTQGVIEPSRRIRSLMQACGDGTPTEEQIRETFALLQQIFETKRVDDEERQSRMKEIVQRNDLHHLLIESISDPDH